MLYLAIIVVKSSFKEWEGWADIDQSALQV